MMQNDLVPKAFRLGLGLGLGLGLRAAVRVVDEHHFSVCLLELLFARSLTARRRKRRSPGIVEAAVEAAVQVHGVGVQMQP